MYLSSFLFFSDAHQSQDEHHVNEPSGSNFGQTTDSTDDSFEILQNQSPLYQNQEGHPDYFAYALSIWNM